MNIREQVLEAARRLPPLPPSMGRLLGRMAAEDPDPQLIAEVVSYDPVLTAAVLRIANSAAYAGSSDVAKITTVSEATMRLGGRHMLTLILEATVAPMIQRPVQGYEIHEGGLWEGSVAIAIAAEELATILGVKAPPEVFTAGLLADIGKIVLAEWVGGSLEELEQRGVSGELAFDEAERTVLGIDHAEIGACVLEDWGLPQQIVDIVRWHHEPERCSSEWRLAADLVHGASHVCMLAGLGGGRDGTNYKACETSMQRLGLNTRVSEHCLSRTLERLALVKRAFDQHAEAKP